MTRFLVRTFLTRACYFCTNASLHNSTFVCGTRSVHLKARAIEAGAAKKSVVSVSKNKRSTPKREETPKQGHESVFTVGSMPPAEVALRSYGKKSRKGKSGISPKARIHKNIFLPSSPPTISSTDHSVATTEQPTTSKGDASEGASRGTKADEPHVSAPVGAVESAATEETEESFNKPLPDPLSQLTQEQTTVLRLVLEGASVYIGGNAGTGKSHLLRVISTELRKKGLCVLVTASTGVSALNIDGNTFHSTFRVPVLAPIGVSEEMAEELDESTESLPHRDDQRQGDLLYDAEVLTQADVIILDEISLLHAGYLESLDEAARAAVGKDKDKFFGGIQIILSGDFLQLTAFDRAAVNSKKSERFVCNRVEPEESECATAEYQDDTPAPAPPTLPPVAANVAAKRLPLRSYFMLPMYSSYCFNHALLHVQLTQSARHQTDQLFLKELNALRVGKLPFRLSRSAFLNPYDPSAIRLFAVKHAVKTFNDQKMIALNGKSMAFPTEVSLYALTRGNESGTDAVSHWSDITQLHFYFAHSKYHFSSHDAQALVKRLITSGKDPSQVKLLNDRFYVYVCGLTSVVQGSTARVAVRFRADTQKCARLYHEQFVGLVSAYMQEHLGGAATMSTVSVDERKHAAHTKRKAFPPTAPTLVKQEPMTLRQLLAAVLPTCQKEKPHTGDLLLQNKYLKVGCRVMLLRNLNHKFVNGSLGTIEDFLPLEKCGPFLPVHMRCPLSWDCSLLYRRVQRARGGVPAGSDDGLALDDAEVGEALPVGKAVKLPIVVMDRDGERVAIPSISLALPASSHDGFFTRRLNCMPLTPAYAFTVHKIQGLTLQHPVLFDAKNFFPCDHLIYVAASRVKEFSQLRMINLNPRMISVHKPSLHFSQRLPTSAQAAKTWSAWLASEDRKKKNHFNSYYLPNWASQK